MIVFAFVKPLVYEEILNWIGFAFESDGRLPKFKESPDALAENAAYGLDQAQKLIRRFSFDEVKTTYTVARHPDYKRRGSLFKWAVYKNGELFEGFVIRDDADDAADEYNQQEMK